MSKFFPDLFSHISHIDFFKQFFNCLSTNADFQLSVFMFENIIFIFFFRQQLAFFEFCFTRIKNNIVIKIDNLFQILQRHIQKQTKVTRNTFQKPDMAYRCSKFYMTDTVSSYFAVSNFYAAAFTYNPFVTNSFVFTAIAFPVF